MADAGWYPDSGDSHVTRYWDGSSWTAQRAWDGATWVATPVSSVTARVVEPPMLAPIPAPIAAASTRAEASNHKRLLLIGGAVVVLVAVGVVAVVAVSLLRGDRSSLERCSVTPAGSTNSTLVEVELLPTNPDRWMSSQTKTAKLVDDALRAQASNAPAEIEERLRACARPLDEARDGPRPGADRDRPTSRPPEDG